MARRELLQTELFTEALLTRLSRGQAVQLLSALASLGKDSTALSHHDWVDLSPLPDAPENTMRLTIRGENDSCWSAFIIFDDSQNVLVMLYAAPGEHISKTDLSKINESYEMAVKHFSGKAPGKWGMK